MKIGVAYYPEQWPQDRWEADARSMSQFGVDVVRIGEFAWSMLEPRRERIEMDWLCDVLDVLAGYGLGVILCTPTAAPPPWLFNRHKSILPQRSDGRQWYYGSRRHVCLNNPAYRKYVRRIVTELARRFGDDRNIYAWQIDNELSSGPTGICYCDECEQAFRMWLKRRYGTIDRLNKQWGTELWSQSFVDWHEIPVPRETGEVPHPSLLLDYRRFTSAQARAFAKRQRDIIEDYSTGDATFTVNEPWPQDLPHINTFSLAEVQDVVSVDNYPRHISKLSDCAMGLDLARSLKGRSFWVMEQQAGLAPALEPQVQPRPGQLRLWAYQAAARGAELISFFRWRTACTGQEMYQKGLLDADGMPGRRHDELQQTVSELKQRQDCWEGRLPKARAAICLDFESSWALKGTEIGVNPDYFSQVKAFHECLMRRSITADFVSGREELEGYDIVVVPMPFIASTRMVANLELYARAGGTLLVTAPAGWASGVVAAGNVRPPGELASLLGVEVKEYDNPAIEPNEIVFKDGESYCVSDLCCVMELRGAESLATYGSSYCAGSPALTISKVEKGKALFLGAGIEQDGLSKVLEIAGIKPQPWKADPDVEVVELQTKEKEITRLFVLNHSEKLRTVDFGDGLSGKEIFFGSAVEGKLQLEAFQPALVELQGTVE